MESQDFFPNSDWDLQAPQQPQQPIQRDACGCHTYMPPGQHNPFEHGVRPLQLEDFKGLAPGRSAKHARQEDEEIIAKEIEAQNAAAAAAKEQAARNADAAKQRHLLELEQKGGMGLRTLAEALEGESRSAIFTCSGQVPILTSPRTTETGNLTPKTEAEVQAQRVMTRPVTIRWGSDGLGRLLRLPVETSADHDALGSLIAACAPATFGRAGEDVLDETYRKAGALPTTEFLTDFCPYEMGIIDAVVQLLLPSITETSSPGNRHMLKRGLRAELYKLNVYSGPSGLFKAHVDTPRSETHLGSLVVCLPVAFEGGELAVRHQGHAILHDWSSGSANSIQWAAFYSDCEHEVLEVTHGHRITLTYNLSLASGTGLLGGTPLNLEPRRLPLFQQLQNMLQDQDFVPAGGYIGIHLTHSYPHTHKKFYKLVPKMLKGVDMALYESLIAAKLSRVLVPISATGLPPFDTLDVLNFSGPVAAAQMFENQLEALEVDPDADEESGPDEDDVATSCSCPSLDEDEKDGHYGYDCGCELDEKREGIREQKKARREIIWINEPSGNRELSRAYLAYGNQAELGIKYTTAALVVKVYSWLKRNGMKRDGAMEIAS
ncbi:hypothetical protein AC578_3119 [Pseudocercospora eumusae]|uniref:Fe2OG dioxygenase domain-containing protein n=1 Tax=Pseudocercospora eumusae TaxID=321146 RepID=A0A139H6G0_9PEZI|nr:hypothetical protein AC578_3119 [Pseudocercospora eumusae]